MTHMLSLLPKSRFEESGVEIPGGLAFLADYRPDAIAEALRALKASSCRLRTPASTPICGPARLRAHHPDGRGRIRQRGPRGGGEARLIVCNSPAQNAITWQSTSSGR